MCSLRRKGCAEGSGGGRPSERASEWIDRRSSHRERRTAAAAIFPTGVYLHLARSLNELFLSLCRGGPTDAHAHRAPFDSRPRQKFCTTPLKRGSQPENLTNCAQQKFSSAGERCRLTHLREPRKGRLQFPKLRL
jgi:hypothetical protein